MLGQFGPKGEVSDSHGNSPSSPGATTAGKRELSLFRGCGNGACIGTWCSTAKIKSPSRADLQGKHLFMPDPGKEITFY